MLEILKVETLLSKLCLYLTIFKWKVEDAGGKSLACVVDIRDEDAVNKSIEETVKLFGGIDILVNNASAISLTGTEVSLFSIVWSQS